MFRDPMIKRYVVSSGITFATAFLVAVLPLVQELNPETLSRAVVISAIFTGLRAGVKALSERILATMK
jgi:hypothetical protein